MIRKHIIFYGRVQGVGFRFYSLHKAESLGLTGWVRNLYDGTVEMEVQGKDDDIDRLILYLKNQRWIDITDMEVKTIDIIDEYNFRERGY
jgi:acylphosphatase